MNEADHGSNANALAEIPAKRKRGRPRKYPKLNFEEKVRIMRNKRINYGETTPVPPGFQGTNGHERQLDSVDTAADVMLGQVVSGVIEAVFDAGYLLCVRVGNSGTTLRGVVFKPGHYVPVSAENDVAPGVQMIRRNEIPVPSDSRIFNPRSRNGSFSFNELTEANQASRHMPRSFDHGASKGKLGSPVASQTPHSVLSRGNVVPVVLQPAILTKPIPVSSESSHVATLKGKEVVAAPFPSNGQTPTNLAVGNEALLTQTPAKHQAIPEDMDCETDPYNQPSAEILHDVEAKSMKLPGMPFEQLVTEVIKRIHPETGTDNNKQTGNNPEAAAHNINQPLIIEPLQTVQPVLPAHSLSVSRPPEDNRIGKMTELLQAVQENAMRSQVSQPEVRTTGSELKLDGLRERKTELEDKDSAN